MAEGHEGKGFISPFLTLKLCDRQRRCQASGSSEKGTLVWKGWKLSFSLKVGYNLKMRRRVEWDLSDCERVPPSNTHHSLRQ